MIWRGWRVAVLFGAILLGLQGCGMFAKQPPALVANLHYVVGDAYQIGAVWRYPQASFSADVTGLATVAADRVGLTADGEIFDQSSLAGGHASLQLPAIVRVTNLENGLQVVLRLNDRGPQTPKRLIALTRRAAELLQAGEASRVRMQVLEGESRVLAGLLQGEGPEIGVVAAPQAAIGTEVLAPPPGAGGSTRSGVARPVPVAAAAPAQASVTMRLPEVVTAVYPTPGMLAIDCGSFSRLDYASLLASRLASLGARVTTSYTAPRDRAYMVRIGPMLTVQQAEDMLDRALAAGVNDAAIVVE